MHRWDCYHQAVASCVSLTCSFAIWAAVVSAAHGDGATYRITDSSVAGSAQRVSLNMEVTGVLRVMDGGNVQELNLAVDAQHRYTERVLQTRTTRQSLRWYEQAEAKLLIAGESIKPQLRPAQRLVMVEASKDRRLVFGPKDPLTREELDLLDLQANSLLLPLLLPDKAVAIGDDWQPNADLLAQLLGIDAVSNSDVKCVLAEAKEGEQAQVLLAGQVNGAIDGVATEIHMDGTLKFDLSQRWITALQLTVREQRAIGHVGPGLNVTCKLDLKAEPIAVAQLPHELTAPAPTVGEAPKQRLAYIAPGGVFQFGYDRRWNVMHESAELLSLRLVDKGELVAQCNISPLKPVAPEAVQTLEQFKASVQKALGDKRQKFTAEKESQTTAGHRLIRLEAIGAVDSLEVEWHYFLVADDRGHQVAAGVTLERSLRERLGNLDGQMMESLIWNVPSDTPGQTPQPAVEAAQKPSTTTK